MVETLWKLITIFFAYALWSKDLDFDVIECNLRRLCKFYFSQTNYTYSVRLLESPVTVNYIAIGNCTIVIRYSPVLPDVTLETNTKGQRLAMDTNHTECISSSITGCCLFVYACICVCMFPSTISVVTSCLLIRIHNFIHTRHHNSAHDWRPRTVLWC